MSLPAFAYTAPTIVWFGPDGLSRLGSYLKRLGVARARLVTDRGVAASGALDLVREAAGARAAAVWDAVEADAPVASVEAGAAAARDANADGIIAVGGGSAIDSGKAIALLAKLGGDLARWDGANKVEAPGLPVVAIPSTAGTGSEASSFAVVKDAAKGRKLVMFDRAIYPAVAVLDPRLGVKLPPALTAATGVDALTHAIEGVASKFAQPMCDAMGFASVRAIYANLPRAVAQGDDLDARGAMLIAASMAGQLVSMTYSRRRARGRARARRRLRRAPRHRQRDRAPVERSLQRGRRARRRAVCRRGRDAAWRRAARSTSTRPARSPTRSRPSSRRSACPRASPASACARPTSLASRRSRSPIRRTGRTR